MSDLGLSGVKIARLFAVVVILFVVPSLGCNGGERSADSQEHRDRQTDAGSGDNLDASTLHHYLKGQTFPAQKEEVVSAAESNGAPQDMVTQIKNATAERFNSPEHVMQALRSSDKRSADAAIQNPAKGLEAAPSAAAQYQSSATPEPQD